MGVRSHDRPDGETEYEKGIGMLSTPNKWYWGAAVVGHLTEGVCALVCERKSPGVSFTEAGESEEEDSEARGVGGLGNCEVTRSIERAFSDGRGQGGGKGTGSLSPKRQRMFSTQPLASINSLKHSLT